MSSSHTPTSEENISNCPFCDSRGRSVSIPVGTYYGCSDPACDAYNALMRLEHWNRRAERAAQPAFYGKVLERAIIYHRASLALTAQCVLCNQRTESFNLHRMDPEPQHHKDCPLISGPAPETGVGEIERLRETVQRYVEHHEHCAITAYHGVRERSALSRVFDLTSELRRYFESGTLDEASDLYLLLQEIEAMKPPAQKAREQQ